METLFLKIRRQHHPEGSGYWENFQIAYQPNMTLISALRAIERRPVNKKAKATHPVAWDYSCLQGSCGACSMLVNGHAALACTQVITDCGKPIQLQPLSKFPVIRDLIVDRSQIRKDLKKIKSWLPMDSTEGISSYSPVNVRDPLLAQTLMDCIQCGACLEACPEYHPDSPFMGALSLIQIQRLNLFSLGSVEKEKRKILMMEKGGIEDCGNAQNCQKVCPKKIPLVESIAKLNRDITRLALRKTFG